MSEAELNHVRALYAAEVTMVDRWVGHFLETIEVLGLREDTAVVLMSDHGHYFGDHGLQGKPWGDLGQLYEPMTHIPLYDGSARQKHWPRGDRYRPTGGLVPYPVYPR